MVAVWAPSTKNENFVNSSSSSNGVTNVTIASPWNEEDVTVNTIKFSVLCYPYIHYVILYMQSVSRVKHVFVSKTKEFYGLV